MSTTHPFETFYQGWLVRQEHFLEQLICAQNSTSEDQLKDLISTVFRHYQSYYEQKSRYARSDILLIYSPPWLTSFERTFLWIAGWKPSMAFKVVESSIGGNLSPEQVERMEQLKAEIRGEEQVLAEDIAKVQETLAVPSVAEIARRVGRVRNGERRQEDSVVEAMLAALEVMLERADILRGKTVTRIVSVLPASQTVGFLAAAAQFQLRIRRFGLQRDAAVRRNAGP